MRIECPKCGNTLGYHEAGGLTDICVSTHRGKRRWVGQVVEITCERCGTTWTPPKMIGGTVDASAA